MSNPKKITLFYSWQSDLPNETNRSAIRAAIREACSKIENDLSDNNILISLDEATRDVPGSPNIPSKIMEKIEDSDIFIADISTINSASNEKRQYPNPNVVFELGFATSHLGWDRIIMLFNTQFGDISKDLPFDFDRHRTSTYQIQDKTDKAGKNFLSKLLYDAIKLIITKSPKRPAEYKTLTPEQNKMIRDKRNIEWILSSLHIPTIDQHLLDSPYMLLDKVIYFWENLNGVIINSLFHLYDKELDNKFREFHQAWHISTGYCQFYHNTIDGSAHIFSNPGDGPFSKGQQEAWNDILLANKTMRESLDFILAKVRSDYIDIDIKDTNQKAWREYIAFKKEQNDLIDA